MKVFGFLAVAAFAALPASAVTIVAYDTANGASVAPSEEGRGITGNDLVRGPGLREVGGPDFNSRSWGTGNGARASANNGNYVSFGFTSQTSVDLDGLEVFIDRNANGPTMGRLQLSVNGGDFSFFRPAFEIAERGSMQSYSFGRNFNEVTSFEARIVGFGAAARNGRADIEDDRVGEGSAYGISVTGDIAPVPVPASLPLMIAGLAALGAARRLC